MTPVGISSHHPSLGLVLPTDTLGELSPHPGATPSSTRGSASELASLCRAAEATGADSLWSVDHLFWPHPVGEAFTTLAVAAASTERPALGTCVLQLPLRRAGAVAKQATALQRLSAGRFILGLGVGSHEGEFRRAGVDFRQRGRLMDDGVARLREAWTLPDGTDPDRTDPDRTDSDSAYVQLPRTRPVPLWFGGASPAARRRAAAVGDGWIPLFLTPEDYATARAALREEILASGRHPDAVETGVVVFVHVGEEEDDARTRGERWLSALYGLPPKAFRRHLVAGTPETCAAALDRFAAAGARHIVVMVAGSPAVEHFGLVHDAFVARVPRTPRGTLVGVSA